MEEGEAEMTQGQGRRITAGAAAVVLAALLFLPPTALCRQDGGGVVPDTTLRRADLVELVRLDSTIRLDVRYATSRNFMGRPMYALARVYLQRPAAEALVRAHRRLKAMGYGILVFDGYRPWRVTRLFWEETPPSRRAFVADPRKGSRHNRGCAVDCSLYDLRTGSEVPMPTSYDAFTDSAAARAACGSPAQRGSRDLLRQVMEREGFRVEPKEWWHFDYRDWRNFRVLDVPFERIPAE
jgi:D-alanyl-D-alanine dipeptidase